MKPKEMDIINPIPWGPSITEELMELKQALERLFYIPRAMMDEELSGTQAKLKREAGERLKLT